jgi:predicted enzyme related to lactoylglutathione lyase
VADDDQGRVTAVPVDVLFAGIPVAGFPAAVTWYDQLFGRPADIVVKADEVMWRVADSAWVYVVGDPKRAGTALVTMAVPDLEGTVTEIGERGITGAAIEIVGSAGRKASVADPDGNTITFIEVNPH